ncbi:MAG: hypothetical protein ACQEUZ_06445 [Pseudomonadota bacterium]
MDTTIPSDVRSLAHAIRLAEAQMLPYSPANLKKVLGSARKCPKLPRYNAPAERIPADPVTFEASWGPFKKRRETPEGFPSFSAFKTWFSNVKSLLEHASGKATEKAALRLAEDDWKALEEQAASRVAPEQRLIPFRVLRDASREAGLQPRDLDAAALHDLISAATPPRKTPLRRAAALLDDLHEIPEVSDSGLLPAVIGKIPATSSRRRSQEMASTFAAELDAWLEDARLGPVSDGYLSIRGQPLSPKTIRRRRDGIAWLYACLVEEGLLDPERDPHPRAFTDPKMLLRILEAESNGLHPWQRLRPSSVKGHLEAALLFLSRYDPDILGRRATLFRHAYLSGAGQMTPEHEAWCRALVNSSERTRAFLDLAPTLHARSAPLIADYKALDEGARAAAVKLAFGAAAAAILTSLPLRAGTLLSLTLEGEDAMVAFPRNSRGVSLAIPGSVVKNNTPLNVTLQRRGRMNPRATLQWFIHQGPRDLLMRRIKRPDSRLLFGGAEYHYLHLAWTYATAEGGFYMTPHLVRHGIASLLCNEEDPDFDLVAALLGNTEETTRRNYAFFDKAQAVERGQRKLRDVSRALSGARRITT